MHAVWRRFALSGNEEIHYQEFTGPANPVETPGVSPPIPVPTASFARHMLSDTMPLDGYVWSLPE